MKIALTKKEAQALEHRMSCCDALQEVLGTDAGWDAEVYHCDELYAFEDILDVSVMLLNAIPLKGGILDTSVAEAYSKMITKALLIECVEGSVWVAVNDWDKESLHSASAAHRTLCNLANKIERECGMEPDSIGVPTY
jgi:dsDNA-binding SOS-regulon protein